MKRWAAAETILDAAKTAPALRHVDDVNKASTAVILEALERSGPMAPGVGEYYQRRAERGESLAPYEQRIARALLQEGPFEAVYEIGSGISALPILMALNGVRSIGVERDTPRADLGREILRRLSRSHPGLAAMCEIRRASAPEALRGEDFSECAAVFTNITSSISNDELEEIIALVSPFRAVIADLSRFFEVRDKAGESELLDRFIRAGWRRPAPLATPRDTYWMFRRQAELDPHDD
jgi:precorrin-6B methylase 2